VTRGLVEASLADGWAFLSSTMLRGRPALRLRVNATLQLRCQRCLEPMPFQVQTDETLVLAGSLAEIHGDPADANAPDRVLAGRDMPVRDLIEDELILAMPYAPRHERCAAAAPASAGARRSPFAGLRGLVRGKTDSQRSPDMAVQQSKKSTSRRGMHRSHDFLTRPALAIEPTTGEVHLRHRVSPTGFYRGKKVVKDKTE